MLKQILFTRFAYVVFFLFSAGVMIIIDYQLGDKAEFLNAWHFIKAVFSGSSENKLQYIYFQDKLGSVAIPVTFFALLLIHSLISLCQCLDQ
jgi:hypothetical protein